MKTRKGGISLKNIVSILTIAAFFTVAQGAAMFAFAADEWETWPRKKAPATETGAPGPAGMAGEEAGKKVSGGISAGTIGWAAAIAAGLIVIGVAAGGGGGGSTTTPAHTTP
jgi:hypothetical protein